MKPKLAALILAGLLLSPLLKANTHTVFLLRHAEKASEPGADPALSESGFARAKRLSSLFENAAPHAIFTSQYKRTQLTAQPLADSAHLAVTVIAINNENAANYPQLLQERICAMPDQSIAVVIGHSNTVPEIISQWTAEPTPAIADHQFDQIFMVRLDDCKANSYFETTY